MSDNVQQLNLFNFGKDYFKIDKPIRLIELFSGIGAQAKSLEILGVPFEHWKTCEWAVNSIKSYNAIHIKDFTDYSKDLTKEQLIEYLDGNISTNYNEPCNVKRQNEKWLRDVYNNCIATHNLMNIMKVKGSDLEIVDTDKYCYIMTYSFPCLVGSTLVLTNNGYKRITDIKVGDYVLTHNNQYQKVLAQKETGTHETLVINAMPFDELILTLNHKVLTNNGWKEAKDLTKKDMIGIAINQNSIIPEYNGVDYIWKDGRKPRHSKKLNMESANFWWLIGRYVGDGWKRTQKGIIICCAKNELHEITDKIKDLFNYSVVEERTVYKVHIPLAELGMFVDRFGSGASNKHLSKEIFDLPIELLKEFLNGYFSADGCFYNGKLQCNSVSKQLIYDLGQCVAKVYKKPYSIYKVEPKPTKIIEGRKVNQKPWWQLRLSFKGKSKGFYDNEKQIIWCPINKIEKGSTEKVYDIEVEKDHSFVANSIIVHNCQDLSLAGQRKGMETSQADGGTRSGLLWEVERLLDELEHKPQVLLMENVPEVVGVGNVKHFHKWLYKLESLGYSNHCEIINAKDFQIPQNRRRCFMVSILGDFAYDFPFKHKTKYCLKDFLEKDVPEKYFLDSKDIERISSWNAYEKPLENVLDVNDGDDVISTITTLKGDKPIDTVQSVDTNVSPTLDTRCDCLGVVVKDEENVFTDLEKELFTKDGNINRYIGSDKVDEFKEGQMATTTFPNGYGHGPRTHNESIALNTIDRPSVKQNLRIRKLVPCETLKLMGFEKKDYIALRDIGMSDSAIYHCSGDSIVVTCLMALFGQMTMLDEKQLETMIDNYAKSIVEN